MGTFSIETSVSSSDFLCLRLQRLRTSSDTVSRAAGKGSREGKGSFPQQQQCEQQEQYSIHLHSFHPSMYSYTNTTELHLHLGNVQIKSSHVKRILFPIQLQ